MFCTNQIKIAICENEKKSQLIILKTIADSIDIQLTFI